ncbi:MAG TPA: amino acid adenylation domain-containing protein [Steroidobacteraceae bacterium]|nr:amino acid adenylation domain-containing protein [Steroidobacteraceae bacterium]
MSHPDTDALRAAAAARLQNLSPEERERLLALARQRGKDVPESLHGLFERHAREQPDAVAAGSGQDTLTYAQLDARADALAKRLLGAGIGRGDLVAITMDRDTALIVAILAVLKAGAAYLPVDPSVPEDRQRFIRDDAQARLVLSVSRLRHLMEGDDTPAWFLDEPAPPAAETPALPRVVGSDLAYVIYTSGSTGQPKGVMIEHGHVMRLFTACDEHFAFSREDVWTMFHSYAFDFSVWEIWGALLYGGRVVVVPHAVSRSAAEMADLVLGEGVTVLSQTPTAFSNLMPAMLAKGSAGALRYVVFGGEALEPARLGRWFDRFGDASPRLVNMYGITETTVHVTYKALTAADAVRGVSDIGAPLRDLTLHVLNERLKPVPAGVVGELYVGGAGVARGYLNRPALTAERFLDSPFKPGERLYRTGDLARHLPEGGLEYVGRNDDQVKLRGFRIELGDIERRLIGHAQVHDGVVALKGSGDDRCLVAYVVLEDPAVPRGEWKPALYRHLAAGLPDYMRPSHVLALAALPVTGNGKIDRTCLPEPSADDVWQGRYEAPRDEAEQAVCAALAGLLDVGSVGIHDNFFALGGDSLKTVGLVARVRDAGWTITVTDVFECPHVLDLARRAQRLPSATGPSGTGPFDLVDPADLARLPAGIESAYPMSRLQQGMVYHNLSSAENSLYHNVISQRYRGALDIERMRVAMTNVMARNDMLRTSFHMDGFSEPLQFVHMEVAPPLYVTDLRGMEPAGQSAFLAAELRRLRAERIELSAPPLFQAHVYPIGPDEVELIWLEHHAILDGWSLAAFMTQLTAEYTALAGKPGAMPAAVPAAAHYRDFIAAEREACADPRQQAFWAEYVADAPYTQLQGGGANTADQPDQIDPLAIPPACFQACKALARDLGVPLKSVFLAAYARVVGKFSGDDEIMVGLTTHGRPEHHESEDLIGLYVSRHPLRLGVGTQTWRELVLDVFQGESAIWARRFYPLADIKRQRGDRELFETCFTYNHFSVVDDADDIGVTAARERRSFEFNDIGIGVAFIVTDMERSLGQINLVYDGTRFDAAFARRFQDYLLAALQAMLGGVDERADVLSGEDARLAALLARHVEDVAPDDSLTARFAEMVRSHGECPAVEQGDTMLTFAGLHERSMQAAAALHGLGIGKGDLVGFDLRPSPGMLAAWLGVLRLGAVFVPLDADQPASRRRDIVADAGIRHVLTEGDLARLFDTPASAPPAGDAVVTAADPAYVIHTSGSTGRPKGVVVTHGNAMAYLRGCIRRLALRPGERVLQVSNTGFDIFIKELLYSLFCGGTLVLRSAPHLPDAAELWETVERKAIDVLCLPTAYWALLCDALPASGTARLRLVTAGGEAMQRRHADRWLARWGASTMLVNSYGPTETTVSATAFDTRDLLDSPARHAGVPLGRPFDHVGCHVLGKDRRPVPCGVAGELYLAGAAVSPGYLGQPERTAEAFLEPGTVADIAERLYRTGDVVRVLGDGQLEFVGRADSQVKIRGYRVEVDEVRHAIGSAPGMRDNVVVAATNAEGDRCLVAYVVLDDATGNGVPAELIAHARARLPGYMRPSAWVRLDALPMTANRKVDLAALPPADFASAAGHTEPADAVEAEVRDLWDAVLERRHVSVEADFFALGGHSLLLTRLLLRIRDRFGVDVAVSELMQARTVREMAALVTAAGRVATTADLAPGTEELEW